MMTTPKGLILMFIGVIVLSAGLRSGSRGVSDDLLLYVGLMIFGIGFLYLLVGMHRTERQRAQRRLTEGRGFEVELSRKDDRGGT